MLQVIYVHIVFNKNQSLKTRAEDDIGHPRRCVCEVTERLQATCKTKELLIAFIYNQNRVTPSIDSSK